MRMLIFLLSLLFLAACSDSDEPRAPTQTGYSVYMQVNLKPEDNTAYLGARLYHDGDKITLAAGDMIVATHNGISVPLKGDVNRFGFYAETMGINDAGLPVNFDIQYLPVEAREDRWYPADLVYVDNGPGQYVGLLNWDILLPEPVTITSPATESTFNDPQDTVTVSWQTDATDITNVRVFARLGCTGQTRLLYEGSNTGSVSGTMDDLFFDRFSPATPALLAARLPLPGESIAEEVAGNIIDAMFEGLFSSPSYNRNHCDIAITVMAEKQEDVGSPFESASIVASQSDAVTIYFRNQGARL